MSLKAYIRGKIWWVKGRIDYNGRPITDHIRCSTGAFTQNGANDWIQAEENRRIRRYLIGDEAALTFADAVMLYPSNPATAKHLIPIVEEIGTEPVHKITPLIIKNLAPKLYPMGATDSWKRWVITPARAVINNAHQLGHCPPIQIKGYTSAERVAQDNRRGKKSRVEKKPGSFEWLLKFREHAPGPLATLALFMFATGSRIGQSTAMDPDYHLDLQNHRVCIPGAKGHADRWIRIPVELVVELANITYKPPRGWQRRKGFFRVFGYAGKDGPRKAWISTCKKAGIEYLPPHSAGRHGFGQEMNVRQGVDKQATGQYGAWADLNLLDGTYSHSENADDKIIAAFHNGLKTAEAETGLQLAKGKKR